VVVVAVVAVVVVVVAAVADACAGRRRLPVLPDVLQQQIHTSETRSPGSIRQCAAAGAVAVAQRRPGIDERAHPVCVPGRGGIQQGGTAVLPAPRRVDREHPRAHLPLRDSPHDL
jgi:hypothetical protein